jgi:hypothetical protein
MWASGINRSSNVGSAAVPLQADRDDLVTFGERGMNRPKHLTRSQPAVQQDQRTPFPDRLAIEIDAVDVGVLAGTLLSVVQSVLVTMRSSGCSVLLGC